MTDWPAYLAGLLGMLVLAALTVRWHPRERWQIVRCALAILINWIAGMIYVWQTRDYTPWAFNIFIDAAAALAVMYHPAGRVQGFLGLFYLFQIAGHTAFGVRQWLGLPADPVYYYNTITWIAWAQLAAMGGWCGAIWSGDLVHWLRDRRDARDRRARAASPRR